jgi:class 3 adenylate cyclase
MLPRDMGGKRTSVLAWTLCVASLLIVAGAAGLVIVNRDAIDDIEQANAIEIVLPIGFALLGGLVASGQPRNVLGWIFLVISIANGIPGLTDQYTRYALVTQPGAPFSPWLPWIGSISDSLIYPSGLAAAALLLIPNGRLVSPRWGIVLWIGAFLTGVILVMTLTDPTLLDQSGVPHVGNPTGMPWMAEIAMGPIGIVAFFGGLLVLLLAAASIVVKMRRARDEERLQLRWVASAAGLAVVINLVLTVVAITLLNEGQADVIGTLATVLGFGVLLPASFGVAILRYRLYDLDLLLNRTILYGAASALLLVAFGFANVLAQGVIRSMLDQGSDLVAGALGLGAGLAFNPLRRLLRPLVDQALPPRSRLALLFTDIVASTQAIVDLGDERWRDVLDRYRSIVRQEIARCRGREVNTAGDAFFAVFDRPGNAVRCAAAMRERVAVLGLQVRTGLHLGDVELRGEQISGLAVHAAARVMAEAGAGEILLSGELAAVLPEIDLRDAGQHVLRGVPGEWHLFRLSGSAPTAVSTAAQA